MPCRIDASSVLNPYATPGGPLEPAQDVLAAHLGVPADRLTVTRGARAALRTLLDGPVLFNLPTCPAYYDLTRGPVIVNQLRASHDFRLDLDALEGQITRFRPRTVVITNPNSPDGGTVSPTALIRFLERTWAPRVILDETFAPFAGLQSLAPLVEHFPHLTVVGGLRPAFGVELGYVVGTRPVPASAALCPRLDHAALREYMLQTRAFQEQLASIPGAKTFPSRAHFSLLSTYRPAADVAEELAQRGIRVRGCGEQWVPNARRYLRVTARTGVENAEILGALREVLLAPLALAA
jgi:histidinol-phosphate/aromatic aminotransferase/cobyric acid decarboxylase-like protein